jgi:hypothetical protein
MINEGSTRSNPESFEESRENRHQLISPFPTAKDERQMKNGGK